MIYVSYGMPKSASTFTYVVTEAVLKAAGLRVASLSDAAKGGKSRLNYVDPINAAAVARARAEIGAGSVVIKTHGAPDKPLLDAIDRGEVFASAVIRDPREIALSLLDHAQRSRRLGIGDFAEFETIADTFRMLDEQVARLTRWMESSHVLLLIYDEIAFDTEFAIQRIVDQVGLPVTAAQVLAALPEKAKVEQFNKGVPKRYATEMPEEMQTAFLDRYREFYRRFLGGGTQAGEPRAASPDAVKPPQLAQKPPDLPPADVDALAQAVVRALYRVLLLRDPDPQGLATRTQQVRDGRSVEQIMRDILRSPEFAEKHERFAETYLPTATTLAQFGP